MLDPRVAPGVHRIDAGRRAQVVAEREIGSGKADRAAAAVAMLHPSLDLPGAAEQLDGLARPAFAQVRTNDGGGVDLALAGHHRLDGSAAETVLGAHRLQDERKSVVKGKRRSDNGDEGGRRILQDKRKIKDIAYTHIII